MSEKQTLGAPMEEKNVKIAALVCAAGVGSRMRLDYPKQYMNLAGAPMLVQTLRALRAVERIGRIAVAVSPGDPYVNDIAAQFPAGTALYRCGGDSRARTVLNGLLSAGFAADEWVLVHDAARPCVKPSEIARLIDAVLADPRADGGLLAVPVADTVKRGSADGTVAATVPREGLWRAATPQMFRAGRLITALSGDLTGITDEASAVERLGGRVLLVPGRATNIKVTQPSDAALAALLLGERNMTPIRIGQGYDSHRLTEGRPLILGGVRIPFEKGLSGHSDADVLLHAVTDAVLGAAALGDIGQLFPPDDPKWEGADSRELLASVVRLAAEKGWRPVNCDATVVAERPKLAPYAAQIRESVAALLGLDAGSVSVKAKTNEKMDAVGRGEGMEAFAAVLLERVPEDASR
jgi:2-C-methyl-D-erythritol 4-phosphate cytidylyltransferase/2-C-methyl-D-erythritol 2,4-cyclodiphosphate synthase